MRTGPFPNSLIRHALYSDNVEVIDLLMDEGWLDIQHEVVYARVGGMGVIPLSPLYFTALAKSIDCLRWCLTTGGFPVDLPSDIYGNTALHWACMLGSRKRNEEALAVVRMLIEEFRANYELCNEYGNRAVDVAAEYPGDEVYD